jgi:hypothetical protein
VAIAWHRVLHRLIAPFFCTSSLNLRLNFAYCVQKTLETHWGKHHRAYVTNLNNQIKGTELDSKDIVSIVNSTWNDGKPTPAFNNAAQTWSALLNSSPRTYCRVAMSQLPELHGGLVCFPAKASRGLCNVFELRKKWSEGFSTRGLCPVSQIDCVSLAVCFITTNTAMLCRPHILL